MNSLRSSGCILGSTLAPERRPDLAHDKPQSKATSAAIVERIIDLEILPALMALHDDTRAAESKPAKGRTIAIDETMVGEFTVAALSSDPAVASEFVRDVLFDGAPKHDVFGILLANSARRLGEMWEREACSFVDVTIALNRLHQILREHETSNPPPSPDCIESPSIFLMPAPGEQHIFGMLILAEHFREQGWRVDIEFTQTETRSIFELIHQANCACMGFTISNHRCIPGLTDIVSNLRNDIEWGTKPILVGGSLLQSDPEIVTRVGADGGATNEADALGLAEGLVADRPTGAPDVIR